MTDSTLRELHRELRIRQRRLGTPAEGHDDFEHVLKLAHEINNRLTGEYLRKLTESQDETTRSLASVCREILQP